MRNIIAIFVFSFLAFESIAQTKGKFNIETTVLRFSKENGFSPPYLYPEKTSFFNALEVGYSLNKLWQIRTGVRILPRINNSGEIGESFEDSQGKGFEINIGLEREKKIAKKLFFYGEAGLFFEKSKQNGIYWQDYPPYNQEINHKRTFFGGYLEFKVGYKLTNNLRVMYSTRARWGHNISQGTSTNQDIPLYPSYESFREFFEPINSLSLRIGIN